MDYYKKKLKLMEEIQKRGQKDGINRIYGKVYSVGGNISGVINKLESAGLIELRKINHKIYSKLTEKGERVVELLIKMDKVLNGV